MRTIVVFLILCWTGVLLAELPKDITCEVPDCNTLALPPGYMATDPFNCHNYYLCLYPNGTSSVSLECPPNNWFNPFLMKCELESSPCTAICSGTPSQNCNMFCDFPGEYINDATDCSKYYICVGGGEHISHNCPDDHPYFDGKDCTPDPANCCKEPCTSYCDNANTQIPDPFDCTRFYICVDVGPVDEDYHKTCPVGEFFDTITKLCQPLASGATCMSACDGGTGPPPANHCDTSMTCTSVGFFQRCNYCQDSFFKCTSSDIGKPASIEHCVDDTVFNTGTGGNFCIFPENCPFDEATTL